MVESYIMPAKALPKASKGADKGQAKPSIDKGQAKTGSADNSHTEPGSADKGHTKSSAKPGSTTKTSTKEPVAKKGESSSHGTGARGGAKAKAAHGKPAKKPKKSLLTKEDEAACKIQITFRKHLADKKKKEYDALMDKLEKEAYCKLMKLQQEEAQRKQEKEDEEKRLKAEQRKRIKRMLDASFDGDTDTMKQIVKEVAALDDKNGVGRDVIGRAIRTRHLMDIINCEDPNGNTAISEAASGGHVNSIHYLLDMGADPNKQGQFHRTPLYRAAFAGHLAAVQMLLQNGGDPRLYAEDGQIPQQIASVPAVAELLSDWDIEQTDVLLRKLELVREQRVEEEQQRKEAEASKLENQVEAAEKEFEAMQKRLNKAYCELEKRINEHDNAVASGFAKTDITLQTVHDAETELELAKLEMEKARDKLAKARLLLREQQTGEAGEVEDDRPGQRVKVRELDDVLFRDVGNKIKNSGKWPLILDPSHQAATFLRYRDTNFLDAVRPGDLEPEKARMALLGALRFGKPLVVDMLEVDLFDAVSQAFGRIMPGLMPAILDKSILKSDVYQGLAKKSDPPEYDKNQFNQVRLDNFKFILVSKNPYPKKELLDLMYPIQVCIRPF